MKNHQEVLSMEVKSLLHKLSGAILSMECCRQDAITDAAIHRDEKTAAVAVRMDTAAVAMEGLKNTLNTLL